jgi:hypothetical protein
MIDSPVFEKGYPSYNAVNGIKSTPTLSELKRIFNANGIEYHIKKQKDNIVKVHIIVTED